MKNNLDVTSLILQLYSLILIIQDYNNSDLMQELQRQDSNYLEKILKNQEEILSLLRKKYFYYNANSHNNFIDDCFPSRIFDSYGYNMERSI